MAVINHGRRSWPVFAIAMAAVALFANAQPAGWSSCDLGDIRIEAGFPQARADGCYRQSADAVAVLVMPEAAGINPSPWYAFRIESDSPRRLQATLVYGEGRHRYWPKVSHDGTSWQRLPEGRIRVAEDGATVTLDLQVGPEPTWIAAQELWPSKRYEDWLGGLAAREGVSVSSLGLSGQGRPIRILRTDGAKARQGTVVLVGRQHPPEVPGALAMQPFVETLLDDSSLSRRFRGRFQLAVVPELNPDGVERGNWRQNAGGMDINRDWGLFTQPETRLVRDLLAALDRRHATRPRVFLDFHATREDVFYTQFDKDPTDPPLFEQRWLTRLQERMPGYTVNRKAGHQAGTPTAKTWVYEAYGIPAVTFEIGDETPRALITGLAQHAARAMMETLLGDESGTEASRQSAATLPAGKGSFTFDGWAGPPMRVWYQRPERITGQTPVVFVMHGVKRDADRYRDEWSALAEKHGFILVVPEFDAAHFPGATAYNLGHVFDQAGKPVPPERWSFAAIEPLFDVVRHRTGTRVDHYALYGHSAGAQFVHRYLLFMPQARIDRAVAANAGWYLMPERRVKFPYGLEDSGVSDAGLRQALGRPMTILLGTEDTSPSDPNLRRTAKALAQGSNRLARGERFVGTAAEVARELNVPFDWQLRPVEGIGHENGGMAAAAAELLLGLEGRAPQAD